MIGMPTFMRCFTRGRGFKKIFKIKADFDTVMERKEETQMQYASFIRKICHDEKLLPFDRTGVAAVIEHGVRLAGRQKNSRQNFTALPISYAKRVTGQERQKRGHCREACGPGGRREDLRKKMIEEKIQEMIEDGIIMIESDGAVVGQVNGLSVYDMGEYAFGKPSRITAKTSMGKAGIITLSVRPTFPAGPITRGC